MDFKYISTIDGNVYTLESSDSDFDYQSGKIKTVYTLTATCLEHPIMPTSHGYISFNVKRMRDVNDLLYTIRVHDTQFKKHFVPLNDFTKLLYT